MKIMLNVIVVYKLNALKNTILENVTLLTLPLALVVLLKIIKTDLVKRAMESSW